MRWNDFAAWIDHGEDVDLAKLAGHNIKTIYIDPNSANAAEQITKLTNAGVAAGIYVVANWYPGASPTTFVATVHEFVKRLIPKTYYASTQQKGAPVMLDLEQVPYKWIEDVTTLYRQAMPRRETAYTNEAFKDGSVVPIAAMVKAGFHFYPQCYLGDMSAVDTAAACLDLARWGVPADHIHPFYDGSCLPPCYRDGAAFTLGRIPG